MNTRQLGNSDLFITPIGFGAWAIGGGGWEFAWGAQDDRDSVAAIREALDTGRHVMTRSAAEHLVDVRAVAPGNLSREIGAKS